MWGEGKTILNRISRKQDVSIWTEIYWLRTEPNNRMLRIK
jgi:hypothetical protein